MIKNYFYNKYKNKYYSQWGEEGIILEILKRLNINNLEDKWLCKFGAWDGIHLSNTFYFVEKFSINAIYIESDKDRFKDLQKTTNKYKSIIPINKFIKNNLDQILSETKIPKDFKPDENKEKLIEICGHYVFSIKEFLKIKNKFSNIDSKIQKKITNHLEKLYGLI